MLYDQLRLVVEGSRCNLRCAYCLAGYADKDGYTCPVIDERAMLELIQPHEFSSISIWGGEPFHNFSALQATVEFCRQIYPSLPIIVISNGTAFAEDKIKFIADNNLSITLSHDAFGQHFRGMDYLKDKDSLAMIRGISNLGFSSVIHKHNCDFRTIFAYFEEVRDLLKRDFYWGFELFQPSGPQSQAFIPGAAELSLFSLSLDFLLEQFSAGHSFAHTALYPVLMTMAGTIDGNSPPCYRCGADRRLTVTTGGRKVFCQVLAENGRFDFPPGEMPLMCVSCDLSPFCQGYCPGMDDDDRRMVCSFYKEFYRKMATFLRDLRQPYADDHPAGQPVQG